MYIERDPSLNASAENCPNPPSTTNYKCTLWGAPLSVDEATNFGQYQDSFQVVIAGSNGMWFSISLHHSVFASTIAPADFALKPTTKTPLLQLVVATTVQLN